LNIYCKFENLSTTNNQRITPERQTHTIKWRIQTPQQTAATTKSPTATAAATKSSAANGNNTCVQYSKFFPHDVLITTHRKNFLCGSYLFYILI